MFNCTDQGIWRYGINCVEWKRGMMGEKDYGLYWDRCWKEEEPEELYKYLDLYAGIKSKEIDVFKEHNVVKVCDVACGFGAYSLALATNGFEVYSFDISDTAAEITKNGLRKYGIGSENVKVASILDTGYEDAFFDGVIAHAVIDHLTAKDAVKALKELFRITRRNGLVLITFDIAEKEDYEEEHATFSDGTMEYVKGSRKGMLFRPHDWNMIDELLYDCNIIYRGEKVNRERVVILKKG